MISFIGIYDSDGKVRSHIKKRGECWRLQEIPKWDTDETYEFISKSRIPLGTKIKYYYSPPDRNKIPDIPGVCLS